MAIIPANNVEIKDEGTSQGRVRSVDFVGAGVSAAVSGSIATIAINGGAGGDIATTVLQPAVDESLGANLSAVAVRSYKIASGKKLTLGLGSRFRIL